VLDFQTKLEDQNYMLLQAFTSQMFNISNLSARYIFLTYVKFQLIKH